MLFRGGRFEKRMKITVISDSRSLMRLILQQERENYEEMKFVCHSHLYFIRFNFHFVLLRLFHSVAPFMELWQLDKQPNHIRKWNYSIFYVDVSFHEQKNNIQKINKTHERTMSVALHLNFSKLQEKDVRSMVFLNWLKHHAPPLSQTQINKLRLLLHISNRINWRILSKYKWIIATKKKCVVFKLGASGYVLDCHWQYVQCTMYCVDGEMHSSNSIDDPLNILYVMYFYHRCDDIAIVIAIALPYLLLNLNVDRILSQFQCSAMQKYKAQQKKKKNTHNQTIKNI